jgi:hypothetical protein
MAAFLFLGLGVAQVQEGQGPSNQKALWSVDLAKNEDYSKRLGVPARCLLHRR